MYIYLFHGHESESCNAIFSSLEMASVWIHKHSLTGIVLRYTVDEPGFDERLKTKDPKPPKYILDRTDDPDGRETYVNNLWHWHYRYGYGENDPGFDEAFERWEKEHL